MSQEADAGAKAAELTRSRHAAVYDGRDAVLGWFAEFANRVKNLPSVTSRHVISNLRMTLREDGSVAASHVLTVYHNGMEGRCATDPVVVTDADEVFLRERGVWKIASRVLTPVFSAAHPPS